jgi:hypothetical protein
MKELSENKKAISDGKIMYFPHRDCQDLKQGFVTDIELCNVKETYGFFKGRNIAGIDFTEEDIYKYCIELSKKSKHIISAIAIQVNTEMPGLATVYLSSGKNIAIGKVAGEGVFSLLEDNHTDKEYGWIAYAGNFEKKSLEFIDRVNTKISMNFAENISTSRLPAIYAYAKKGYEGKEFKLYTVSSKSKNNRFVYLSLDNGKTYSCCYYIYKGFVYFRKCLGPKPEDHELTEINISNILGYMKNNHIGARYGTLSNNKDIVSRTFNESEIELIEKNWKYLTGRTFFSTNGSNTTSKIPVLWFVADTYADFQKQPEEVKLSLESIVNKSFKNIEAYRKKIAKCTSNPNVLKDLNPYAFMMFK